MHRIYSYFWLIGATLIFSIGVVLSLHYSKTDALAIQTVQIICDPLFPDQAQLTAILNPLVRQSFFGIHPRVIQQSLESLPEISRVSIRRIWPQTLRITIVPTTPIAHWNDGLFLNRYAEPFQSKTFFMDPTLDLPKFNSKIDNFVQMEDQYQQFEAILRPLGLKINQISLDFGVTWCVELSNSMTLKLDQGNSLKKLRQFVTLYSQLMASSKKTPQVIDLRYDHGFSVQWKK